ncbi:MAG: hypothetical protein H5T83_14130 [Actinotalea sp.]|nr:hypothetical protein [Actinotalea sp.]
MDSSAVTGAAPVVPPPPASTPRPRGVGAALAVAALVAGGVGAATALLVERARWADVARDLAALGFDVPRAAPLDGGVLASAGLEAGAAVLAGALLGLALRSRLRALGVAAAAVTGWAAFAWLGGDGTGLGLPWPGAPGAHPSVTSTLVALAGPVVLLAGAAAGVLLVAGRGGEPLRARRARAAGLVVLGLVLVGTALTAALLAWSSQVAWADAAAVLQGGVLPGVPVLVALAWSASGRHPVVPTVALVAAGAVLVEALTLPAGSAVVAFDSGEWTALALVAAAGATALATTAVAAHRHRVHRAIGTIVV